MESTTFWEMKIAEVYTWSRGKKKQTLNITEEMGKEFEYIILKQMQWAIYTDIYYIIFDV